MISHPRLFIHSIRIHSFIHQNHTRAMSKGIKNPVMENGPYFLPLMFDERIIIVRTDRFLFFLFK